MKLVVLSQETNDIQKNCYNWRSDCFDMGVYKILTSKMIKNGIKPQKKDNRDYSFHRTFGEIPLALPLEFSVDAHLTMPDQNADGLYEACSAYAQQELITDQNAKLSNFYRDHYQRTLDLENLPFGSGINDIRDSLKIAIAYYGEGAYYAVENSQKDWFDSIRSVIYTNFQVNKIYCAVSIGTPWMVEWDVMHINSTGIIPTIFTGDPLKLSWHNWAIKGWKIIDCVPYLLGKTWQGKNYADGGWAYYPREAINAVMAIRGTCAYTLAPRNEQNIQTVQWTIVGMINACINRLKTLI